MRTLLLPVDPQDVLSEESQSSLHRAAAILRAGGTVAFPTETVYGLGANALDEVAVRRIFEAKQRPDWDPLIVHIAGEAGLQKIAAAVSVEDRALMEAFWPGPLTLLLDKRREVPDAVTAGRPKVGVRIPAHLVARQLLERVGLPLAAPSANSFGRTSPTTAQHVLEDLDGRIDAVLDGGPTTLGLESTVIDANAAPPTIYRPGMIPIEQIRALLPRVVAFVPSAGRQPNAVPDKALPAPGVGLRHYAPVARLMLMPIEQLQSAMRDAAASEGMTGVLLPEHLEAPKHPKLTVFPWGKWDDADALARRLFLGLRALDGAGVTRILCPIPDAGEVGAALRDRLEKAARPR